MIVVLLTSTSDCFESSIDCLVETILEQTKSGLHLVQSYTSARQNARTRMRMLVFIAFTRIHNLLSERPSSLSPFLSPSLSLSSWRATLCLKHGWKSDQPRQILFSSVVRKRFERKHFGRERDRGRHGNYNLGSPTTRRFSTPLLSTTSLLLLASFRTGSPLLFPLSFSAQVGRFKPIRCGEKETLGEGRVLTLARYDSVDVGQCFSEIFFLLSD